MTRTSMNALLVTAVMGTALSAGCGLMGGEKETTAREPAPASQSAASQPAATDQQSAGDAVEDLNDDVVTAKVKAKLADDEVTKAYQIEVETFKGAVQLSGSVDSEEARTRATELAKDVGGVKNVKNSLQVRESDG